MAKWINLLEVVYPIGSIYQSTKSVSPASIVGGTWNAVQDKFLLGCGEEFIANSEGGEIKHTLTTAEMPSHTHPAGSSNQNPYFYSFSHAHSTEEADGGWSGSTYKYPRVTASGTISETTSIRAAGGGNLTTIYLLIMQFIFGREFLSTRGGAK